MGQEYKTKIKQNVTRFGARGVPGGPLPPKHFAWPPSGPPKFSA